MAAAHYFWIFSLLRLSCCALGVITTLRRSAFCRDGILARVCNGYQLAALSVIPVSFPAAFAYCGGFAVRCFWLAKRTVLIWGVGNLGLNHGLAIACASLPAPTRAIIIAGLIVALIAAILWKGAIKPADITSQPQTKSPFPGCVPSWRS